MTFDPAKIMQSAPGAYTTIGGREYLYFVGTGYLGLHGHPEILRATCEATMKYGMGSATSRRAFGNTPPMVDVEARAAEFFGMDDAFYFMSGYLGNSVVVQAIGGTFDVVLIDESSHYSVRDAAVLSQKPMFTFGNRDPDSLAAVLKEQCTDGRRPLVITDGVFPVRGALAPVREYYEILKAYPGSALSVDDAHALGAVGPLGRGSLDQAGLPWETVNTNVQPKDGPRLFLAGTLSKAFGGFGGIVPGSADFIAHIHDDSPYFRAANPVSPGVAAGCARALELVRDHPEMLTRLHANVKLVRDGLRGLGIEVDDVPVPIVCVVLDTVERMQRVQAELMEQGILIAYNPKYSDLGPKGGIRIAVFATHTEQMIQRLIDGVAKVLAS
ncbi:MAG: pyridoxal phosphate-dependent aminotransferase family protein [Pirellulales bacterium]|nr:pyridoxal phosphate-dependent aminotransferase family protein [Pirellulales bacterium]